MRSRRSRIARVVACLLFGAVSVAAGPCHFGAQRADLNWDGYVDISDGLHVLGCVSATPALDPDCARSDIDADGDVDALDLASVVRYLGKVLFDPALPSFEAASVQIDGEGVIYLLAPDQERVFRWSLPQNKALRPLVIGSGASHAAVSVATERLFIAYPDGRITQLDLAYPVREFEFAALGRGIGGLASAGEVLFVAAVGSRPSYYTFRPDGSVAAVQANQNASREFTWSPAKQRLYHFRDDTSPNDLLWNGIDPVTGAFTGKGDSPYHGGIVLEPPIRVARDGSRVLLGTGDFYDGTRLAGVGSLPFAPVDADWREQGDLLTLDADDLGGSVLRRFDAGGRLVELAHFAGDPLRVLDAPPRIAIVTQLDGRPTLHAHRPSQDSDRDRVPNEDDAFPVDPAASQDSDGDGFPDAWNRGRRAEDSTTGLVLDAFPLDEACQLPEHGLAQQPDVCDQAHGVPDYAPLRIEADEQGVIYLLSPENARIYRWSVVSDYHLPSIHIGKGAYQLTWSAENGRLYVGYEDGAIRQIDVALEQPGEQPFAALDRRISGLVAAGRFVVADDGNRKRSFAPDGSLISTASWSYASERWAYSESQGRLYHTQFPSSDRLLAGEIDPVTGILGVLRGSAYGSRWTSNEAVRVAPDGSRVARGGGVIHDGSTLAPVGTLPTPFHDAQWLEDGRLLTLRKGGPDQTVLEQWDAALRLVDVALYPGLPYRVLASAGEIAVITASGGQPRFASYEPTHDGDEDGVLSALDAFPLDPAASQDSDADGAPDAWNPGAGPEDSTTGLVLDAFPFDDACQLPEHGLPERPEVCDLAHGIPVYQPVKIVADGAGVIYLLSPENQRVYRWSIEEDYHLKPIRIGADAVSITFSAPHGALYVSYANGAVTRIEPGDPDLREAPFAKLPKRAWGLHPVEDLLLVAGWGDYYSEFHLFDAAGTRLTTITGQQSSDFAWDPVRQRLYYFNDGISPNDLFFAQIDPFDGTRLAGGQSPYHGDYGIFPPIRVSPDGALVLLGSGNFYESASLEIVARLGTWIAEAEWLQDGSVVTLRDVGGSTLLERRDADLRLLRSLAYPGKPLRLLETAGEHVVVTQIDGRPAFSTYVPSDDGDLDGVLNAQDAFPVDPAASRDGDGDGAPDAWNPGSDETQSTTGLRLDAFPADRACQRAEHGVGGVCDFHLVMPPAPAQGLCDEDLLLPAADSGMLVMDATSDFVPLCNGWIIVADRFADQIRIENAIDGRRAAVFELSSRPDDIELDDERRRLYVALPEENALARIDLNDGASDVIPLSGVPYALALGSGGGLHITVSKEYVGDLYWLAEGADAPVGGWPIEGRLIRWNPVYGELIVVRQGLSPVRMMRYGFDPVSGPVLLQTNFHAGGNAQDLKVSHDGEHVALPDGAGNLGGYTIADYLATDIESYRGEWKIGAYPQAADFDADSERLLTTNGTSLVVYDVQSFEEQERWVPSGCAYGSVRRGAAFSRGGAIAFLRQECNSVKDVTRYHWFVTGSGSSH